MKNSSKYVSLAAAAALAGVALFAFANASFTRSLPADVIVASGVTLAILAFAARDYARALPPMVVTATVLRPVLRMNRAPHVVPAHKQRMAA